MYLSGISPGAFSFMIFIVFLAKGKMMKNNTKFLTSLLCLSFVWCFIGHANETVTLQNVAQGALSMLLPINAALPAGKRANLLVEVPQGFKCLQSNLMSPVLEFIPKDENDLFKWSETISTQIFLGRRSQSKVIIDLIKNKFFQKTKNVQVLEISSEDHGTYNEASMLISYTSIENGRSELLFVKYYSGPYDASGLQYSIALNDVMTQDKAIEKIREFLADKVKVINF